MSKKSSLLFFPLLLISAGTVRAQTPVMLHPKLGMLISAEEKKQFHLFPSLPDSTFSSAQLFANDDETLVLRIKTTDGKSTDQNFSADERTAACNSVERFDRGPFVVPAPSNGRTASENLRRSKVQDQVANIANTIGFFFTKKYERQDAQRAYVREHDAEQADRLKRANE